MQLRYQWACADQWPKDLQVCGQSFREPIAMDGRNESPSEASSSKYDDVRSYV